jgi:hypothetical protein
MTGRGGKHRFENFFVPQMADTTIKGYPALIAGAIWLDLGRPADESSEIFAASPTVREGR